MDHVGIVVGDLAAATAFFVELGLVLQGDRPVDRKAADDLLPKE
jgi:catechol 2,3-dioxygenase-like lactoylglutathione lyase family enzyme